MEIIQLKENLYEYLKKISHLEEAVSVITWDLRTGAPKKGVSQRGEVIGSLSAEIFNLSTSSELKNMLKALRKEEIWQQLDVMTKKSVQECEKTLKQFENIPADAYKDFVVLTAQAEAVWEEAKEISDFQSFQPYLEKIVAYQRQYTEWKGYEGNKYNALLDDYEPGLTTETVDLVFQELKEAIVPLVKKIAAAEQPETAFLFQPIATQDQEAFSKQILNSMGYDFAAGRLDTTVHPFAIGINPGDVRVTTKYDETDFRTAVFGTIHEGGHALYEQNISTDLLNTPLAGGSSMGIHESQSLFWENFVGRNYSFWKKNFPLLKKYTKGKFDAVDVDDFYRGVNFAGPSLIRIEADELTYCLHIIIRYELEKALINAEMEVSELPEAWDTKMEEVFGIRPGNDGEGVLQDVHWAGGDFGYFPSYALGYVYAAQLNKALLEDLPNFEELLSSADLTPIREWMTKHVHQYGKMKEPLEIIREATGEGINAAHLIDYLINKYKEVYSL